MIIDVRKDDEVPTEIMWRLNPCWNIVKTHYTGIGFKSFKMCLTDGVCTIQLLDNKDEAENLIKALQKAIELGWVK